MNYLTRCTWSDAYGTVGLIEGTSLRDAITGLTCTAPSQYQIQNSSFDQNYISIHIRDGDFTGSHLTGTTFSCTNGKIEKSPYSKDMTYTHIMLTSASNVNLGALGQPTNYIYNALYGIKASESDIISMHNYFDFLPTTYNNKAKGTAIYADNELQNKMILGDNTSGKGNYINNWWMGVACGGMNEGQFYYNKFANNTYGLVVEGQSNLLNTSHNDFNGCKNGITFAFNEGATVNVMHNKFNQDLNYDKRTYGKEAINIYNKKNNINASVTVSDNIINNNAIGVHLVWSDGAIAENNHYTTNIPNNDLADSHYGILVQNCGYPRILDNTVERNYDAADPFSQSGAAHLDLVKGISIELCISSNVSGNTIKNMGTDIRAFGNCAGSSIRCNNMHNSYQGINLVSATINNPQGSAGNPTDNSWNGTFNTTGINNKRVAGQAAGSPVVYFHRNSLQNLNLTSSQYDNQAISPIPTTGDGCMTQQGQGREATDINLLLQIAGDSIVYSEFIEENRAIEDAFAFNVLSTDSTILEDSLLQDFYNIQQQAAPGILEQVDDAINNNDAALASTLNAQINDSTPTLQNQKQVNEIFIDLFMQGDSVIEPDSAARIVLEGIAYQNPITGGPAVYTARSILGITVEDNFVSSRSVLPESTTIITTPQNKQFDIYPNPAKDGFTIEGKFEKGSSVLINDFMGRIIYESAINNEESQFKVNVLKWPAGIYFYQVNSGNNKTQGKVSIIK